MDHAMTYKKNPLLMRIIWSIATWWAISLFLAISLFIGALLRVSC